MFFSDIESFCNISEAYSAKDVARYLSLYFELISSQIIADKGTIDKYIGDSVMAFWGAPEPVKNHEEVVAKSILNIQRKMHDFSQNSDVIASFKTRFALHSGNVVVGNIGSKERFNYSIIGNNVNICSRLESLNKRYGTYIILYYIILYYIILYYIISRY